MCERYKINISNLNDNSNCSKLISHLKLNVKNELIYQQIKLLNTNRKLNFSCIFKKDTLKTEFLDTIKNPLHKKCINKFRLGNHKLRVETGRHTVPQRLQRILESVLSAIKMRSKMTITFFFLAPFYENIRNKIFLEIHEKYSHFNSLDNTSKI